MRFQLHISALNAALQCGHRFKLRYVDGQTTPKSAVMAVGDAVDKAAMADLENKIRTGSLLPEDGIKDIVHDVIKSYNVKELQLTKAERALPHFKVANAMYKKAQAMAAFFHSEVAPNLNPIAVQRPVSVNLDRFLATRGINAQVDLVGTIDILEPGVVRDLKATGSIPDSDKAEDTKQLTGYALALLVEDGALPEAVYLDNVVYRVRGCKWVPQKSTRDMREVGILLDDIADLVRNIIDNSLAPDPSWRCVMCNFRNICEYSSKKGEAVEINSQEVVAGDSRD